MKSRRSHFRVGFVRRAFSFVLGFSRPSPNPVKLGLLVTSITRFQLAGTAIRSSQTSSSASAPFGSFSRRAIPVRSVSRITIATASRKDSKHLADSCDSCSEAAARWLGLYVGLVLRLGFFIMRISERTTVNTDSHRRRDRLDAAAFYYDRFTGKFGRARRVNCWGLPVEPAHVSLGAMFPARAWVETGWACSWCRLGALWFSHIFDSLTQLRGRSRMFLRRCKTTF